MILPFYSAMVRPYLVSPLRLVLGNAKCGYKEDEEKLFFVATGDRKRSNGFKLQQGKFGLDVRRTFLS